MPHDRLDAVVRTDFIASALKLQMHAMLLSTSYNSVETVLSNLYHCFTEVAQKSYHYVRSLPPAKQPSDILIISKSSCYHGGCPVSRQRRLQKCF